MSENPILWQASEERRRRSAMYRFMRACGYDSYESLYRWSIEDPEFWRKVAEFCGLEFSGDAGVALRDVVAELSGMARSMTA